MTILISLKNINVRRKDLYRLKNVNLTIYVGEKIALLGKSGAGKSTLISVTNGTIKATSGDIKWKGKELNTLTRRESSGIGTLWQDLRLIEELNVAQNINCGALGKHGLFWSLRNMLGLIEKDKCTSCLEAAGLSNKFLTAQLSQLSGGQRQRIAIARLIRQESELILADEPFANLDPILAKKILKILLYKNNFKSIRIANTSLISIHQLALIKYFTRVIGLKDGEIIFDKPIKQIDQSDINSIY